MKEKKEVIRVTYKEANEGKEFANIDESTMPEFREKDYSVTESDKRYSLIERLRTIAFPSLPAECVIENTYSGILATDLFSLNTLLGSMIESKVVAFLNSHRDLWDDSGDWKDCHFIRSNESFPDVRLVNVADKRNVVLGIELKSWFILSKEGEPSFRYKTASEACDKGDLLCIVPWYLSDAVCGNPVLTSPWVFSAKAASEMSKRHWVYLRQCNTPKSLTQRGLSTPDGIKPYMENARDKTNYTPLEDGGNNFGRLARTGIMDNFVKETLMTDILGIPANNWRLFLKAHTDADTLSDVQRKISQITQIPHSEKFNTIINELKDYIENLPQI